MMLWNEFYDLVMPEVPGVPANLVDLHLKMTAIDFLEDTQAWLVVADPIDVLTGVATYALVPPTTILNADVSQVKTARFEGSLLTFTTMDEMRQSQVDFELASQNSPMPRGFTQYTQDTLTLVPASDHDSVGGLTMKLVLRPSLTATGVEEWIGAKWIQEIATGTRAVLMAMHGKPWSIPEGAMANRAQYEAAKTRATVEVNRSFTRAISTIQMPRYG